VEARREDRLPELPADREAIPPGGWHSPPPQPMPVAGPPAGWWSRAAAAAIDGLILSIPVAALSVVAVLVLIGPVARGELASNLGGVLLALLLVLAYLLLAFVLLLVTLLLYAGLSMGRPAPRNGQTLGKQALGIRVVRLSGDAATFWSAAMREVAIKSLLFGGVGGLLFGIPTVLDFLWPLWDGEKRALHDMLADTRVVLA
jgi:uncharacterized RDD family membrane protein YckC